MEDTVTLEESIKMKNSGWFPFLKPLYTAEDVIRYFDEAEEIEQSVNYRERKGEMKILPSEKFFTDEVFNEGLELLSKRDLNKLKRELHYLQNIKIPELEEKIKSAEKRIKRK